MKHYIGLSLLVLAGACGNIVTGKNEKVNLPPTSNPVVPSAVQPTSVKKVPGVLVAIYAYVSEDHSQQVLLSNIEQEPLEYHVHCLPDGQNTTTKSMTFSTAPGFAQLGYSADVKIERNSSGFRLEGKMLQVGSGTKFSDVSNLSAGTTNSRRLGELSASYFGIIEHRIDFPEAVCGR